MLWGKSRIYLNHAAFVRLSLCLVRVDSCDLADRCTFSWLKQTIHQTHESTRTNKHSLLSCADFEAKP